MVSKVLLVVLIYISSTTTFVTSSFLTFEEESNRIVPECTERSHLSCQKVERKISKMGEVVVAQLVERSLLIPEVRVLDPVIGKIYIEHLFTCLLSNVLKRQK